MHHGVFSIGIEDIQAISSHITRFGRNMVMPIVTASNYLSGGEGAMSLGLMTWG
jgi:hypothetical protein